MVLLFDQFHLPENIFEVVFATEQQVIVAKMLLEEFKANKGVLGKTEMSLFANRLHDGVMAEVDENVGPVVKSNKVRVSYNKRQFYDRILTPMKAMGMVDYDMYKKHYALSDKFVDALKKIGMLWSNELKHM